MLEFRVLGPLQVERDGHLLPLGGFKQRGVLALHPLDGDVAAPGEDAAVLHGQGVGQVDEQGMAARLGALPK